MKDPYQDIEDFYQFLARKHPVNCPKVAIHLHEDVIQFTDGRICSGFVRFNEKSTEIHVTLKRDSRWLVKKTIAHEYKHILQRYADGTLPTSDVERDNMLEKAAWLFGQRSINDYRELMRNAETTLDEVAEHLVECGIVTGLRRECIQQRYADCLEILKPFYSTIGMALSDIGKAVKRHPAYPRHTEGGPMTFTDAREYERDVAGLGIATGWNKFQGWAHKWAKIDPDFFN